MRVIKDVFGLQGLHRIGIKLLAICCLLVGGIYSMDAQDWKFYVNHEVQLTYGYYFKDLVNSNRTIPELGSQHEIKLNYKTNLTFFSSFKTIFNQHEKGRRRIWANEAYLGFNKNKVYGKIGRQIIKWGTLTGWSNLDMANVYDYYDFLRTDEEALGVFAADVKFRLKKLQLQVRLQPSNQTSRLYFQQNRWIRLPNQIPTPNGAFLPVQLNEVEKISLKSPTYGLGLNLETESLDLRLNWYSGQNDIPQRSISLNPIDLTRPIPFDIQLVYHRLNIASLSLVKLLGEWSVWTEFSHIKNQRIEENNQLSSDAYLGLTIGIDRLFIFENPEKQLKLLGQYLKNFTDEAVAYQVQDLDHVLDHAFLLDADFQFNYSWKASLRSVLNLSKVSHYLRASLSYKIKDNFSLLASMEHLSGNAQHFFGYYGDNSRFFLTLKYQL